MSKTLMALLAVAMLVGGLTSPSNETVIEKGSNQFIDRSVPRDADGFPLHNQLKNAVQPIDAAPRGDKLKS